MFIIRHRNIFFAITGALIAASLIVLAVFGLRLSIDFTGGTLVGVSYEQGRPPAIELDTALKEAGFKNYSLREAGERNVMLRTGSISNDERENLVAIFSLDGKYPATVDQLSEIGPTIGAELRQKALISIALVILGPASTRDFALTLLVGIIAGTYSSIFLATPLLVTIERKYGKRK